MAWRKELNKLLVEVLAEQEKEEASLWEKTGVGAKRCREKKVTIALDSDSDDPTVVMSQLPTVNPITKKQMTDPVRNNKCNHIYQKSTIHAMIKQVGLTTPLLVLSKMTHIPTRPRR